MTAELLLDNSAWARLEQPALAQQRVDQVADWMENGQLAVCLPFLLEAGYSARNARDHAALLSDLTALPSVHIDERVETRALAAQSQLAQQGHHRMPPVDVLTAALADVHGLGILHYDGDYETLAERTDLQFDSVWLAPRGSI